jgi:drug/metabolite transporter (DMT)-like permease
MLAKIPASTRIHLLGEHARTGLMAAVGLFTLPLLLIVAATTFAPLSGVGTQLVVGSLALLLLHMAGKGDFVFSGRDWVLVGAMSLLGVIAYRTLAHYALSASLSSSFSNVIVVVLLATMPLLVMLLSFTWRRHLFSSWALLAALMSATGVAVALTGRHDFPSLAGADLNGAVLFWSLAAALALAGYTLIACSLLKRHALLKVVAISTAVGALPFLLPSLRLMVQEGSALMLTQGLTVAVAYLAWNYALQHVGVLRTTIYANLALVISGYLLLTWQSSPLNMIMGLALLSSGVIVLHRRVLKAAP